MGKRFLLVLVVALVGAFLSSFGEQLGQLYVPLVLIGTCLGGAVALMPIGTPISRAGAFFVGFAFEAIAVLLRAALLPSTASGRAVGAFIALAFSGVVFALTKGRLPYPAMLLGVALIEGAYALRLQPSLIVWEMPSYLAGPIFAAGVGFTVCVAMMAIFGDRIGVRDAEWPVARTRDGEYVDTDGTVAQNAPVGTEPGAPAGPPTYWNPPPSQPPRPEPTS